MIDRATVERIMNAANIVDVVSEFVSLRKVGANYRGLCPFHDDKSPSFYVSPSRGICHCFSCGKGGNAAGFIMEHEQMSYPEALRWLARKYNIEIHERELTDDEKRQESERESMFIVNEWAAADFQRILHEDPDGQAIGMQYFRSRGFRDDTIQKFRLGFDPQDRLRLAREARQKGYQDEFLLKTGLCYRNDRTGDLIDRFAGRVVFPWISMSGKVVGFTARVLDSRTKGVNQKYVNSPDSDIYHKANELYGIYQAKRAISKENNVYLVEGQADVISMHQCGIENVVAGSGTALSAYQIRMLHRFTQNITLIYDDDAAGHHAALEGTDKLLTEGMNLRVLLLPDGMDPDEFARSHTADEFKQYIEKHQTDFITFKAELLLRGVTDPVQRSEAINSIVRSISMVTDQVTRATYLHLCSQRFSISEEVLTRQMNNFIRNGRSQEQRREERQAQQDGQQPKQPPVPRPQGKEEQVEYMLMQAVVRNGERLITVKDQDGQDVSLPVAQYVALDLGADELTFQNKLYNRMLAEAVDHLGDPGFSSEAYFLHHPDVEVSREAAQMSIGRARLSESLKVKDSDETLRRQVLRLVLDFRIAVVNQRLASLKAEISRPGQDGEQLMKLMKEYSQMQQIRNYYARQQGNDIITT